MLKANREEVVRLARSLLETRWSHQGRDPANGIDCAGLILWVGWESGHIPRDFDVQGYRREPDGRMLQEALQVAGEQKAWPNWLPGDFVLLRDLATIWPCHLGFLVSRPGSADPNIIHCWAKMRRRCVEVRFDQGWQKRMVGLYGFRGIN